MNLGIIILPLIIGVINGLLGRYLGTYGTRLLGTSSIMIGSLLSIISYYEIAISESPLSIYILDWIDTEYLEIAWLLNIDSLSISIYIPVLIVSTCVHIYSIEYMSGDPHNPRFYSYLSLFTFFMLVLISGDNLLIIFIGWEGVGVCSYILVNFWYKRIQANKAAMKALIVNRIGDWGLSLGMILMWWIFGNLELSTIFSLAPLINVDLITMVTILVLLGAMAKSAQLGLHTWLPDAMEGPTPVSALIHAATMVTAGVYLLIRLSPLIEYSVTGLLIISWIGGLTALFAGTTAMFQNDLKRVIAYSTCSQLGYMVLAVGLSQYTLSVFHLVNHAYFKALLFLSAGAVIHSFSDEQDMRKYGGLINILPFTYISILIGSLSLLATPFLTGFYSKDLILEVAYGQYNNQGIIGYWLGTITASITSFYSFRLIYLTFISYSNGVKYNYNNAHEPSIIMTIPLVILGLFSIFHGYYAKDQFIGLGSVLWGNSIYISPDNVSTIEGEFGIDIIIKLLPLLGSVTSIIIGVYIYKKGSIKGDKGIKKIIYRFLNKRYHIDNIYNSYIISNVYKLANITSKKIDKGILELIGVTGIVRMVKGNSTRIAKLDSGYIPNLALNIIIGLILILGYATDPGYIIEEGIILILVLMMIQTPSNKLTTLSIKESGKNSSVSNSTKTLSPRGIVSLLPINFADNITPGIWLDINNSIISPDLLFIIFLLLLFLWWQSNVLGKLNWSTEVYSDDPIDFGIENNVPALSGLSDYIVFSKGKGLELMTLILSAAGVGAAGASAAYQKYSYDLQVQEQEEKKENKKLLEENENLRKENQKLREENENLNDFVERQKGDGDGNISNNSNYFTDNDINENNIFGEIIHYIKNMDINGIMYYFTDGGLSVLELYAISNLWGLLVILFAIFRTILYMYSNNILEKYNIKGKYPKLYWYIDSYRYLSYFSVQFSIVMAIFCFIVMLITSILMLIL